MNLALPALIVFALLLPGFVFRSGWKRAERQSLDYSPFGHVVTGGVICACVLHAVWLTCAWYGSSLRLDTQFLVDLLSASPNAQKDGIAAASSRDGMIAFYFGTMIAFALGFPPICRWVVRRLGWDSRSSRLSFLFRLDEAPWYYFLKGADFPHKQQPDLIYATAIVNAAGTAMLYRGVVDDFHVGPDGELDRLILSNTTRRLLSADKPNGNSSPLRRIGKSEEKTKT